MFVAAAAGTRNDRIVNLAIGRRVMDILLTCCCCCCCDGCDGAVTNDELSAAEIDVVTFVL